MGLTIDEQLEQLSYWIEYRGYHGFDALYDCYCINAENVHR